MEKTLNQLMLELQEIASQHRQINEFFQGDFLDAISRDAVQYPLMVATLQPGGLTEEAVRVNVIITVCDKYNHSNYRQINEVHSDCLSICNDLNVTFRQYRWTEFADVLTEIGTDPFINEGQDMVAGWTMSIAFSVFNEGDWCSIPYDDYDFENGYAIPGPNCPPCDDATAELYFDSELIDTLTIPSGDTDVFSIDCATLLNAVRVTSSSLSHAHTGTFVHTGELNGKPTYEKSDDPNRIIYYDGTKWILEKLGGGAHTHEAAPGDEAFPWLADWSLEEISMAQATIGTYCVNGGDAQDVLVNSVNEGSINNAYDVEIELTDGVNTITPSSISVIGNTITITI